jgi:hypothetical protein
MTDTIFHSIFFNLKTFSHTGRVLFNILFIYWFYSIKIIFRPTFFTGNKVYDNGFDNSNVVRRYGNKSGKPI